MDIQRRRRPPARERIPHPRIALRSEVRYAIERTAEKARRRLRLLYLLGASALLVWTMAACSAKIPGIRSIASTAYPSEQIGLLQADLQSAREAELGVLSPTWFARAEHSLEDAQSQLGAGGSVQAGLADVAEGRAALGQAETFAEVARQTLPSVIQARVEKLDSESAQQQGRIAVLRGEAEREGARLDTLEAERRFNQRFGEVSALFAPGEAEVYKKGSNLVIRVRSIQFPVGSAVLLAESYPLLAKVQRAITSSDQPRVLIEGHTDSTGSAEVNDRISQARADAVQSYLVSNATVDASRISAIGMGFSEPLASDRTAEGRAQNRRIDEVIDAGAEQELIESVSAGPVD